MAVNTLQKLPFKIRLLENYSEQLEKSGFKVDPLLWITASTLLSAGTALTLYAFFPAHLLLEAILGIALLDLSIGWPYFNALKRIDAIEEDLPSTLRQMGDILKSGGTYEYALHEVAQASSGPLQQEFQKVLRKLEEGENFENSLATLQYDVDSRIVRRTISIIIDAVRAGAGLADVMDQIADDVREIHHLARERKSKTLMQFLFIALAGGIVAPLIFGFVTTILHVLLTSAQTAAEPEVLQKAIGDAATLQFAIQIYLFVEVSASSLLMAIMREGTAKKSIIYFPLLLLVAYTAYYVGVIGSSALVGSAG